MSDRKCHYCRNAIGRRNLTVDHIVPTSRGGEDSAWNKVPACKRCNVRKGSTWPTCQCQKCRVAVDRHATMGTTADGPGDYWLSRKDKVLELKRLRQATRPKR